MDLKIVMKIFALFRVIYVDARDKITRNRFRLSFSLSFVLVVIIRLLFSPVKMAAVRLFL